MAEYSNDVEIRVFRMRRSGNHAIVNWIGAQAPSKPYCFICAPNDGSDPFRTGKRRGHPDEIWQPVPKLKHASPAEIDYYRKLRKEVLIYTYEDFNLQSLEESDCPHNREQLVGLSKKRIDVLVVRDLFNWVASKLKVRKYENLAAGRFQDNANPAKGNRYCPYFQRFNGWQNDAEEIRGLEFVRMRKWIPYWVEHAKELLGMKKRLNGDVVVPIHYDRWFADANYRRAIAESIGFTFTDACIHTISNMGGGSSFDGLRFQNAAQDMGVLNRWHHFQNNRHFVNLLLFFHEAVALNSLAERGSGMEWKASG